MTQTQDLQNTQPVYFGNFMGPMDRDKKDPSRLSRHDSQEGVDPRRTLQRVRGYDNAFYHPYDRFLSANRIGFPDYRDRWGDPRRPMAS